MGALRQIPNMLDTSLASSDWLVPLLLYGPVLNETNERALSNAFISSREAKYEESKP